MIFSSIDPRTGEKIEEFQAISKQTLKEKLSTAQEEFESWNRQSLSFRQGLFQELSKNLSSKKAEAVRLISKEMGKSQFEAVAEVNKCIDLIDHIATDTFFEKRERDLNADGFSKGYTSYQGKGVILGIMPWNFPFWQVFRFALPSVMLGNTVLLKHAPNTLGCGVFIEKLFLESGFSRGVFQNLIIPVEMTEYILSQRSVRGVSLTGSTKAGKAVAELAGRYMKKCVFELGGSDPYIVFEDAEISKVASTIVKARLLNSGQSCISPKRILIHCSIAKPFEKALLEEIKQQDAIGPLARNDLRECLQKQVDAAVEGGAEVVIGGKIPEGQGYFYPITMLKELNGDNPQFGSEYFGPVFTLTEFESREQAIELANQSAYGLGAAIFTKNIEAAEEMAKKDLDCGMVFVNDFVKSHKSMPFGGEKDSGYGRELSEYGYLEFANIKTIVVK